MTVENLADAALAVNAADRRVRDLEATLAGERAAGRALRIAVEDLVADHQAGRIGTARLERELVASARVHANTHPE